MTKNANSSQSLTRLLEEHRELMGRITELRKWWSELDQFGLPKFGEMGTRVEELRDILAEHFAEEEKDGYLAQALAVAPQYTQKAEELQKQHGQMLETLGDFSDRLELSQPPFESWQKARDEFEGIVAGLRQHERAENEIVQSAFENDIGTGD